MPGRLIEIFDESKTKVEDRYKKIASCEYQGVTLSSAENLILRDSAEPVGADDALARVIESPSHADSEAKLYTAQAFAEAFKRGLSVQQLKLTTPKEVHTFGTGKVETFNAKKPTEKHRSYLGYVWSICSVFREAESPSGERLFGVFSTPEPGIPSHADVFVIVKLEPAEKLAVQGRFHDFFKLTSLVPKPMLGA
ncbi:hypothetical protein PS689_00577 [Pseudomonas fluorescens]|nr:hypothetical protein [Pseudomonas alliivorans]VVN73554.1 hypothetical protein PS689_00577 [Pseudomonas fluorescens]